MKKIVIIFMVLILLTCSGCFQSDGLGNNRDDLFKKNHTVSLCVESLSKKEITVDDGEALIVDYTPYKNDYIFKGWYTDSSCTVPYDFSRPVTTSFNLYAGFVLKTKTIKCPNVTLKALSKLYDNDQSFLISLVDFDYDYLEKNGMGLQFNIIYDVKYIKDYDVLWDIGYAGAPKYEISLINDYLEGYFEVNIPTKKNEERKVYTYNTALNFSRNKQVSLFFSTDNVQNIIKLSDIVVIVDAIKVA